MYSSEIDNFFFFFFLEEVEHSKKELLILYYLIFKEKKYSHKQEKYILVLLDKLFLICQIILNFFSKIKKSSLLFKMDDDDNIMIQLDILYHKNNKISIFCNKQKLKSIGYFKALFTFSDSQGSENNDYFVLDWLNLGINKRVIEIVFSFLCNNRNLNKEDNPKSFYKYYYENTVNDLEEYTQLLSLIDYLLIDNDNIILLMLLNLYMMTEKYKSSIGITKYLLLRMKKDEVWQKLVSSLQSDNSVENILPINRVMLDLIDTGIDLSEQIKFMQSIEYFFNLINETVDKSTNKILLDFTSVARNFIALISNYKVYPNYFFTPILINRKGFIYLHLPLTNMYNQVMITGKVINNFKLFSKSDKGHSIDITLKSTLIEKSTIFTHISFTYNKNLLTYFKENELMKKEFDPKILLKRHDKKIYNDEYTEFYLEDRYNTQLSNIDISSISNITDDLRIMIHSRFYTLLKDFNSKWSNQFFELVEFNGLNYNIINLGTPRQMQRMIKISKVEFNDYTQNPFLFWLKHDFNTHRITFMIDPVNIIDYPLIQLTISMNPLLELLNIKKHDLSLSIV